MAYPRVSDVAKIIQALRGFVLVCEKVVHKTLSILKKKRLAERTSRRANVSWGSPWMTGPRESLLVSLLCCTSQDFHSAEGETPEGAFWRGRDACSEGSGRGRARQGRGGVGGACPESVPPSGR